jgi:hypothetical protein
MLLKSNRALLTNAVVTGADGTVYDIGFSPYVKEYTVTLPAGTYQPPTVEGYLHDSSTFTINTQTSGVLSSDDIYTISLNIPNSDQFVDDQTYTFNFKVTPSGPETQLISGTYNKGLSSAINNDDYVLLNFVEPLTIIGESSDYYIDLDTDKDGLSNVRIPWEQYTLTQVAGTSVRIDFKTIDESIMENISDSQLIITIANPTHLEPDIDSSKEIIVPLPGRNPYAKDFRLIYGGESYSIEEFNSEYSEITIPLPSVNRVDILNAAVLEGTTVDSKSSMSIPENLSSGDPVVVTAEDGFNRKEYTIATVTSPKLLNDIKINDLSITNFNPYKTNYSIQLPSETRSEPIIRPVFYDGIVPNDTSVEQMISGSLNDNYEVVLNIKSNIDDKVINAYHLNFVVDTNREEEASASSSSHKKKSSDKKSSSAIDEKVINVSELTTNHLPEDAVDEVISILEGINTPRGAKNVLREIPQTIEALVVIQKKLSTMDEQEKINEDIARLLNETERLIALLRTTHESEKIADNIISAMSDTYHQMDESSSTAIAIRNSLINLSNTSIEKVGAISTNWNNVNVKDGRVYLEIPKSEFSTAVYKASRQEKAMEKSLETSLEPGLENAVVSTITIGLPQNLKQAPKAGFVLENGAIDLLKENSVEQLKLKLGLVSFNINDKFLAEHEDTSFEFDVTREMALTDLDKDSLPQDTKIVGAPVVELSVKQNKVPDDSFNHPLQLIIHLDYFDYKPKSSEVDQLVVGRLNEMTGQWERVGGRYDKATNSMVVYRSHMSKYTVLKNEKNISTLEDSWAKNQVAVLKGKGIISSQELFDENAPISREEFSSWLTRAYGLDGETLEADIKAIDQNNVYYSAFASNFSSKSSKRFCL